MKTVYRVKCLNSSQWVSRYETFNRSDALRFAKGGAADTSINHHVYMLTKTGKTRHVFTAYAPLPGQPLGVNA